MKKTGAAPSELESSETIGARLDVLEKKMDRLRTMYESYFMGNQKRAPQVARTDLHRLMIEMQQSPIRNAALRFRFQTLQQRWSVHTTYWNRTLREIEAGTYRRDIERAQRRMTQRGHVFTEQEAVRLGIPSGRAKAFVDRHNRTHPETNPTSTSTPAPASTPTPGDDDTRPDAVVEPSGVREQTAISASRTTAGTGHDAAAGKIAPSRDVAPPNQTASLRLSDDDLGKLLRRWNAANRKLGTATTVPTPEKLRAQLESQIPRILKDKGGSHVTFDIATKDGKVVIKVKSVE